MPVVPSVMCQLDKPENQLGEDPWGVHLEDYLGHANVGRPMLLVDEPELCENGRSELSFSTHESLLSSDCRCFRA